MRHLVLIRHGESAWNRERRVQGQAGTGLSDLGHEQADLVAAWVALTHPDAVLVSSDLQRCRETVAPIAERLGATVTYDDQLRERRFGRWEGRLLTEIQADDTTVWDRWRQGEDVVGELGGETGEELSARASTAFRRHLDALPEDGTVVVVTHGGPIWHGLTALLRLHHGVLGGVGNTAVSQVGADGERRWLEIWNQTAHLPAELRTSFRPSGTRDAPAVGR
jgi:glucosyl-3-phosphoglycerate phosphatase